MSPPISGLTLRQITYNTDGMPTTITDTINNSTVMTEYAYDGDGIRAKKTVGNSSKFYINDYYEINKNDSTITTTKYIFAGNKRIAMIQNSQLKFYHQDHLGSNTLMSLADMNTEKEKTDYMPFGEIRNNIVQNTDYGYTDQEFDSHLGLYNYNARLYDPAIGVFITADTIVPDWTDPQTLNRYSYCYNNPLRYVDPDGHFIIAAMIAGAVVSAISAGAQSDWDSDAMLTGALIGGIAGGVGAGVSGLVGGGLNGAVFGGLSAGATSGGLNAAQYGGDIGGGMFMGAVLGGISGATFGGIADAYGSAWTPGRVMLSSAAGGWMSTVTGGNFSDGAMMAGGLAMMAYGYNKFVDGRVPAGQTSSGDAIEKPEDRQRMMAEMNQNPNRPCVGLGRPDATLDSWNDWLSEHTLRWIPNNIPMFNDIGFVHDFLGGKIFTNSSVWNVDSPWTMAPAAVWTLGATTMHYAPTSSLIYKNPTMNYKR
ncbi:MAG: RHS repeat-associated core domain-containing protein [Proteobacteria bacterium]|nr:RHS repeat-associated core domain-containing protein [Pseudomonadota bacterium]